MYSKILVSTLAGAALLAAQRNPSLSDILQGGVKRAPASQQAPRPQAPPQELPRQAAAPQTAPAAGNGFRMQLPQGWRAELVNNRAVLARSADGASTIVIAPVSAPPQLPAEEYLRKFGAVGLKSWFPDAVVQSVVPSRTGRSGALAALQFRGPNGPGRAAALLVMTGGYGTLYVIGAPAASFAEQQPGLIQVLRSFSFDGQGGKQGGVDARAAAVNLSYARFSDPNENSFSVEMPAAWQRQGGLLRKSAVDVRAFVRTTSPDGAITVMSGDPNIPPFAVPTQTLGMTGFPEGAQYGGGVVRRYTPGLQFAQQYAGQFARSMGCAGLQGKDARQRPDLTGGENGLAQQVWSGGEVSFVCNLRGRESAGYVLAATKLTSMYGTGLWTVTTLIAYIAPVDQVSTATGVVRHMMQTAQINPQWFAQQQQTTAQTAEITRQTNERISQIISDTYWSRQRVQDRAAQNYSDAIRGVVRLQDPDTGEEIEGRAGQNYYWRVRNTGEVIGNNTGSAPPQIDVTELQQIR